MKDKTASDLGKLALTGAGIWALTGFYVASPIVGIGAFAGSLYLMQKHANHKRKLKDAQQQRGRGIREASDEQR